MATTNNVTMTIRTNKTIKNQASELFKDLGLDMSTAVNMFLRQAVREERIPFEVSRKKITNRKTLRALKDAETAKNTVGPFKTVDEVMDFLNA